MIAREQDWPSASSEYFLAGSLVRIQISFINRGPADLNGEEFNDPMMATLLMQTGGASGILGSPLVMMIIVMGIFYVMLILPQQRQRKKTQAMLAALKNGDKVVTNSGIYGTVNGIDGDTVILKIADQVKIRILRSAIAQVEAEENAG